MLEVVYRLWRCWRFQEHEYELGAPRCAFCGKKRS